MLENTMIGILRAQNNIALASQNQRIASSFIGEGRVRVRHKSEEAVKEGEELISKGNAIKTDTFEYLDNAMNDLNSDVNFVTENNDSPCEESYEESETGDNNVRD
jgi:hypothetical protein